MRARFALFLFGTLLGLPCVVGVVFRYALNRELI